MELSLLRTKLDTLGNRVGNIQGQYSLMKKEYENTLSSIKQLEADDIKHRKAVELLSVVQQVTRDRVKNKFEDLVSWALSYVFDAEYKFILEFGSRGNLPELNFKYIPPNVKEPIELTSGGALNITSLILRIIIMELMHIKGFIFIDEALSFVNGKQNAERLNGFLEQIQEKFKRQIIHITDRDTFKENSNYNTIEITKGDS